MTGKLFKPPLPREHEDGTITVRFDPQHVIYNSDIARAVGVSELSARRWIRRRLAMDALPHPLFSLALSDGQLLNVWAQREGKQIIEDYKKDREYRLGNRRKR